MEIHNYPTVCEELKPCPFCGHTPMWWLKGSRDNITNKTLVTVQCPNCSARQETGAIHFPTGWAMEKAIKKWNNRV